MLMRKTLLTLTAALALSAMAGAQTISIDHLNESHSLVRVQGNDRYMLLPVQETAPAAEVKQAEAREKVEEKLR